MSDKADCGTYEGILLLTSYVIQYSLKVNSAFRRHYWRSVWIPTKQITFLTSVRYWKKWEYTETVHQPSVTSRRPIIQLGGKNSAIFSLGWYTHETMKLVVRPIKMSFNETYSKFHTGQHLSDMFSIQKGLQYGDALVSLLFNFPSEQGPRS
jgi:hypothetical protein